jgi:two-component system, NarL family, nitrate/nitrite response regulator NarL
MPKAPVRILIVEDHALLAESLAAWISRQTEFTLVGRAEDGEAGIKLGLDLEPDVILADVELPGVDGLELVKRLLAKKPDMRFLTMSGRTDPYMVWKVSQSGAHGYVEKTLSPEVLVEAIRTIAEGNLFFSPMFQQIKHEWLSQSDAFQKILSDREQEVLRRVVAGWNDEDIGRQLDISANTVAVHRKHVRQKLELHNDRELVAYARMWGLDKGGDITAPA